MPLTFPCCESLNTSSIRKVGTAERNSLNPRKPVTVSATSISSSALDMKFGLEAKVKLFLKILQTCKKRKNAWTIGNILIETYQDNTHTKTKTKSEYNSPG